MDPLNIDTVNGMVARLATIGLKDFDRTLQRLNSVSPGVVQGLFISPNLYGR
ncbi:hypothetical protein BDV39DRAFT_165623 [Aspergillus sergii]|uniref:Uncharacterized protein n=1 Tax=Aspergillus sergii TaxID=1034303 RepID=A0A5N6XJ79_9EURO|nr:hypothetical protein BDV39DRAFT_165623 [Aspergillus sergii]